MHGAQKISALILAGLVLYQLIPDETIHVFMFSTSDHLVSSSNLLAVQAVRATGPGKLRSFLLFIFDYSYKHRLKTFYVHVGWLPFYSAFTKIFSTISFFL
jgi:hypothetical protein